MDSLIEVFHIDIKLLLAQMINFAIVFGVIYYFVLKPLMKVMGERTEKIEKSLEDAKEIERKMEETQKEYNLKITEAKKEANDILTKANETAEKKKIEIVEKAKGEIGILINKEKANMQVEKAATLKEIKKEVADLVVASLKKILEEKVDLKKDMEIIKKSIAK